MDKTVGIYAAALVVTLIGAYLSWTWESETDLEERSGVTIVSASPEELESVRYEEDDIEVTLERREDALGPYVWASTVRTRTEEPAKEAASKPDPHEHDTGHTDHDAGGDAGPKDAPEEPKRPEPKTITEELEFKAGDSGEEVMERMAPFRAIRKLDEADPDDYASYGLDDPRGELSLTLKGGKARVFEVGGEGYGHRNVYLRDTSDGSVYLIDAKAVRPLRHADTRMAERTFSPYSTDAIEKLVVTDGTARVEAEQKNRDDSARRMWVPAGTEERNESLQAWISKFLRVRGTGFASEAEEKRATEKALTVRIEAEDGEPIEVSLFRGETEDGGPAWFVRSNYTRGLMKISRGLGADLANDFPTVVESVAAPNE